jgi:alpha-tubulin suppressor-like RCC1 family protein
MLGNGTTTGSHTPVAVSGGLSFSAIAAATTHTCALTSDGVAYCWGLRSLVPEAVSGGLTFVAITVGGSVFEEGQSCGLTRSGAAYCWGQNQYGQLGDGSYNDSEVPVAVTGGYTFSAVDANVGWTTCALTTSGSAYCWGRNYRGELGTGSDSGPEQCDRESYRDGWCSSKPVAVAGGHTFASLSPTCGVTVDSVAYCWGGWSGGLGTGTWSFSNVPVKVGGQP